MGLAQMIMELCWDSGCAGVGPSAVGALDGLWMVLVNVLLEEVLGWLVLLCSTDPSPEFRMLYG